MLLSYGRFLIDHFLYILSKLAHPVTRCWRCPMDFMYEFPYVEQPGQFFVAGLPEPGSPAEMTDPQTVMLELVGIYMRSMEFRTRRHGRTTGGTP